MSLTDSSFVPDHRSGIGNAGSVDGPEGAAERLTLAVAGDPGSRTWFERHDGPTLLVAVAIYATEHRLLLRCAASAM